jgi:hypothetical protein
MLFQLRRRTRLFAVCYLCLRTRRFFEEELLRFDERLDLVLRLPLVFFAPRFGWSRSGSSALPAPRFHSS